MHSFILKQPFPQNMNIIVEQHMRFWLIQLKISEGKNIPH